jgi:hypothetical protein
MYTSRLESLRECCSNEKSFLIIYDGGSKPDTPVLVCKSCFDNFEIFHIFIKKQYDIKDIVLKR